MSGTCQQLSSPRHFVHPRHHRLALMAYHTLPLQSLPKRSANVFTNLCSRWNLTSKTLLRVSTRVSWCCCRKAQPGDTPLDVARQPSKTRPLTLGDTSVKLIAAAGVLVFSVVWLLTTALSLGDASFVVPIANMGFVAAFVFSLTYKLEQITSIKVVAIATAIVSIGFLTYGL